MQKCVWKYFAWVFSLKFILSKPLRLMYDSLENGILCPIVYEEDIENQIAFENL